MLCVCIVTPAKRDGAKHPGGRPPGSASKRGRSKTAAARAARSQSLSSDVRPTTRLERANWDQAQRQQRELEESLTQAQALSHVRAGLSWTYEECVLMIQFVIVLMLNRGFDKTTACQTVAQCGKSYPRVLRLVNHWFQSGEVLYNNAARGMASPSYSRRPIELTAVHQAAINEENSTA